MAQPLSFEDADTTFFITTKTQSARLWFVNNPEFETAVLAYLAKYQEVYSATIYAFIIMGNHYHLIAKFPKCNKAQFMRSLNAIIAKIAKEKIRGFDQGRLWSRRYSCQVLPRPEDIKHWYYYCALNPVASGLCRQAEAYRGYNSYKDSRNGVVRKFKVFDRKKYNDLVRHGSEKNISREDYTKEYSLIYSRLPGFEVLGDVEIENTLSAEYEQERLRYIGEREEKGQGFARPESLYRKSAGQKPRKTKSSSRYSCRPLVLTLCIKTKSIFLEGYFSLRDVYIQASNAFRLGDMNVVFPLGTYPPSLVGVA